MVDAVRYQPVRPAVVERVSGLDEDREYRVLGVCLDDRPAVAPSRPMRITRALLGGPWCLLVGGTYASNHRTLRAARVAASRVEFPEYA